MTITQSLPNTLRNRVFHDITRRMSRPAMNEKAQPIRETQPDPIPENLQVTEDVFRILPGGRVEVASKTCDKIAGQRHRYQMDFAEWMVPATGEMRLRVGGCGCQGWFGKAACGHGLALDQIINAEAVRPIIEACGEISACYRVPGDCSECKAEGAWNRDRAKDTRPLFRAVTRQTQVIDGRPLRGYIPFDFCGVCGQRQLRGGK